MSTGRIVGHEAIDNGQTVIVIRRSERPMGGLVGFILGALVCLVFSQELVEFTLITIILSGTVVGYVFSKGESTKEIQKSRVIHTTRERNYAAVDYVINDNPLGDITNQA